MNASKKSRPPTLRRSPRPKISYFDFDADGLRLSHFSMTPWYNVP